MTVLGGIDQPSGAREGVIEPDIAHLLGSTGGGEDAGDGAGDTVETGHDEEGGDLVVEELAGGDGEVVNESEWVDTVYRREEDLTFDQVTVMLHELHHHVSP